MTTNAEAARVFLIERRDLLSGQINQMTDEITVLEGRRMEINHLLEELDTPMGQYIPRGKPMDTPRAKPAHEITAKERAVHRLVVAAGEGGLTAQQVSKMMDIPNGTASSCLSTLKARGLVGHKKPVYWAKGKKPLVNGVTNTATPNMLDGLNV